MAATIPVRNREALEARVESMARRGIEVPEPGWQSSPGQHPVWSALRGLGTELWLDTGDLDEAARLWSSEFTALTTNNTLLSKEVGKGIYDELIAEAGRELRECEPGIGTDALVQEVGILLNARHGLRLVERFGCRVSVELHTDLANDVEASLRAARRLYAACPSHFIVKVPLTPAGVLVARRLGREGIPINFTLEFSARQNYVVARIADPDYVNVFLGRLNSFVADNDLGDGRSVGEKATLASQRALLDLRRLGGKTRQIAASMREPVQVATLAGVDVYTMPIPVAQGMPELGLDPQALVSEVQTDPRVEVPSDTHRGVVQTLWEIAPTLERTLDGLVRENLDGFSPDDLSGYLADAGAAGIFPRWSAQDLEHIAGDGKIPSYARWRDGFESADIGVDAALNAAGMASFAQDQHALDERIRSLL